MISCEDLAFGKITINLGTPTAEELSMGHETGSFAAAEAVDFNDALTKRYSYVHTNR